MQFNTQKSKGFVINYELAEQLEVLNELLLWEEEYNQVPLLEAIEKRFGVEPERICSFEYLENGDIQGLQGFDYDATYILFDDYAEKATPYEWDALITALENNDTDIIEGSWAELQ